MTEVALAHHGQRLLYRVGEAAEILGIGRSKTWELVARGEIKSVKIDGARRITKTALEAYVAGLGTNPEIASGRHP